MSVTAVEQTVSVEGGAQKAPQCTMTAPRILSIFRRSVHSVLAHNPSSKFLSSKTESLQKTVPVCLELASTAFTPIEELIGDKVPMLNIGIAAVQCIVGLRSLVNKVTKAFHALKEKGRIKLHLNQAQKELLTAPTPRAHARAEVKIEDLIKDIAKCNRRIFRLLHLPPLVTDLAASGLKGMYFLAERIGHIKDVALLGLQSAASIAGAAAGGLGILLGGIENFVGIRGAILAYREKKRIDASLETFSRLTTSSTGIPDNIWGTLRNARSLQLSRQGLKANKDFQLSVLKACGGSLATIAGALAIAAAFTHGAAATGIGIASVVVGVIGVGISAYSFLQRRKLRNEIRSIKISQEQLHALTSYINSPDCTEGQKQEIALLLGIDLHKLMAPDIHLVHEFRKMLCTHSDTKEIAEYLCTGKASQDQKLKIGLIFDKPFGAVNDHQIFFEGVLRDCFMKKKKEISKTNLLCLTEYFKTKKPSSSTKERAAEILGIPVRQLKSRESVLEEILAEMLIEQGPADEEANTQLQTVKKP